MKEMQFKIYKGLQKPITFRGFKGPFIAMGAGCLIGAFILGSLMMAMTGAYGGFITFAIVLIGGFSYIARRQKKGLSRKKSFPGIYCPGAVLSDIQKQINLKYAKKIQA